MRGKGLVHRLERTLSAHKEGKNHIRKDHNIPNRQKRKDLRNPDLILIHGVLRHRFLHQMHTKDGPDRQDITSVGLSGGHPQGISLKATGPWKPSDYCRNRHGVALFNIGMDIGKVKEAQGVPLTRQSGVLMLRSAVSY
jgi:hypothetical protein